MTQVFFSNDVPEPIDLHNTNSHNMLWVRPIPDGTIEFYTMDENGTWSKKFTSPIITGLGALTISGDIHFLADLYASEGDNQKGVTKTVNNPTKIKVKNGIITEIE
jgi:hypothetical protein